jgi:hypothetical protein
MRLSRNSFPGSFPCIPNSGNFLAYPSIQSDQFQEGRRQRSSRLFLSIKSYVLQKIWRPTVSTPQKMGILPFDFRQKCGWSKSVRLAFCSWISNLPVFQGKVPEPLDRLFHSEVLCWTANWATVSVLRKTLLFSQQCEGSAFVSPSLIKIHRIEANIIQPILLHCDDLPRLESSFENQYVLPFLPKHTGSKFDGVSASRHLLIERALEESQSSAESPFEGILSPAKERGQSVRQLRA